MKEWCAEDRRTGADEVINAVPVLLNAPVPGLLPSHATSLSEVPGAMQLGRRRELTAGQFR
jgi:hypothetical protein